MFNLFLSTTSNKQLKKPEIHPKADINDNYIKAAENLRKDVVKSILPANK